MNRLTPNFSLNGTGYLDSLGRSTTKGTRDATSHNDCVLLSCSRGLLGCSNAHWSVVAGGRSIGSRHSMRGRLLVAAIPAAQVSNSVLACRGPPFVVATGTRAELSRSLTVGVLP